MAKADEKKEREARKQIVLRLSTQLWADLANWAETDFRSINGQIEYILHEAVKKRKGKTADGSEQHAKGSE